MLTGPSLTFDLLARTRNEAATFVLAPALDSDDPELRLRAMRALVARGSEDGLRSTIIALPRLGDEGWQCLQQQAAAVARVVTTMLDQSDHVEQALAAIDKLHVTAAARSVVDLSLRSDNPSSRREAANVALNLAWEIGREARRARTDSRDRDQLVQRLAEALRTDTKQISLSLVDAFLSCTRWDDGLLKQVMEKDDASTDIVLDRLGRSRAPGVVHLLAHWIQRQRIPVNVQAVLQARADELFQQELFQALGPDPSATALSNIQRLQPLSCLRLNNVAWDKLPNEFRAAAIYAIGMNETDDMRQLRWLMQVARQMTTQEAERALATVVGNMRSLDIELIIRSVLVTDPEDEANLDPAIQAVSTLLDFAVGGSSLASPARKALSALNAEALIDRIDLLSHATARRLGAMVRKLDTECANRVEPLLRHSVCRFRMRGIRAAVAMGLIDEIPQMWLRMFQGLPGDHQESRLAAIEALKGGTEESSLDVLRDVVRDTHGVIQQAAISALEQRLQALPPTDFDGVIR